MLFHWASAAAIITMWPIGKIMVSTNPPSATLYSIHVGLGLIVAGFTLALNSFAAVLGVFVLRWRQPRLPRPYRVSGYPLTPLVYLALTGWTLWFVLADRPREGLFGLLVVASGLLFYLGTEWLSRKLAR